MNLNLGSGNERLKRYINYDVRPVGDVCGNCEEGLPFINSAFDAVLASHILEHIHDLRALKKELCRVMKPGGMLTVVVPYYLSPDAWGDDTHCRAFSMQSFIGDFWPGFALESIRTEERIKLATKEKITWIRATLKCTSESQRTTDLSGERK